LILYYESALSHVMLTVLEFLAICHIWLLVTSGCSQNWRATDFQTLLTFADMMTILKSIPDEGFQEYFEQ
jgi:hypothetical protein